jgi:molecular chaperone DnaK
MEITRYDYEELIRPLLLKTLTYLDESMSDARLQANQVDKVVLVGGATRTPLVHTLLEERLGRPVHAEIEPDLAVAMGAAVQGGLIAGVDVGPILVDITPHTLGIETLGHLYGFVSGHQFSPIIERNTPLPATRTEIYTTSVDNQDAAHIRVFQGENPDTRYNTLVGEFLVEGLAEVPRGNQILVRLDLDLNGILKVTATERATGLAKHVVIDNAMERFRKRQRSDAVDRLDAVLGPDEELSAPARELPAPSGPEDRAGAPAPAEAGDPALRQAIESAQALITKAEQVLPSANEEDAAELRAMLDDLRAAIGRRSEEQIRSILREVEEMVFYLEDA